MQVLNGSAPPFIMFRRLFLKYRRRQSSLWTETVKCSNVHVMFSFAIGWRASPLAPVAICLFVLIGVVPDRAQAECRRHLFSEHIYAAEGRVPYHVDTCIQEAGEDDDNLSTRDDIVVRDDRAILLAEGNTRPASSAPVLGMPRRSWWPDRFLRSCRICRGWRSIHRAIP